MLEKIIQSLNKATRIAVKVEDREAYFIVYCINNKDLNINNCVGCEYYSLGYCNISKRDVAIVSKGNIAIINNNIEKIKLYYGKIKKNIHRP